jgi:hypothetical protein
MTPAMRASRLLGWVSFAVGAAELLAPRKVARAVGMNEDQALLLRACGARQVATGVGAHTVYPVPALWARAGGDLVDLGILAVGARRGEDRTGRGAWIAMAAVGSLAVVSAIVASKLAAETALGKNDGPPKDYSARSGFPGGVDAARGAGIVRDAMAGKAGGAAAGDVSPAGEAATGRSSTDLTGAPESTAGDSSATMTQKQGRGSQSTASEGGSGSSAAFIGSGQTMSEEAQKVIPDPPSYTPA